MLCVVDDLAPVSEHRALYGGPEVRRDAVNARRVHTSPQLGRVVVGDGGLVAFHPATHHVGIRQLTCKGNVGVRQLTCKGNVIPHQLTCNGNVILRQLTRKCNVIVRSKDSE